MQVARPQFLFLLCFLCFFCLLCFLCLPSAASADELRLKDGTKIVGTIVGFEDNCFKVETSYGFALVRKDKVASIIISEPEKKPAAESRPPAPKVAPEVPAAPRKEAAPVASAPAPEPPMREEVERNSYTNHTYAFRMYKPPSWELIEGARKMLPNAIVAMGTSDETTLLVISREALRTALDSHAAATDRRLREFYENYRALGEKRISVAGLPAVERRFRGTVDAHDWSGQVVTVARANDVFTIIGMTYADSDLIQIQENVIARTIASLEFIAR